MSSIEFNRREFLKVAAAGGAALAVKAAEGFGWYRLSQEVRDKFSFPDFLRGVADKNWENLSFVESLQLAVRLDRVYDSFEFKPELSQKDLYAWALEVLPMFEYEGLIDKARVPQKIEFVPFLDGDSHNHTLGRSDCQNYAVLNLRVANPHSSWFRIDDAIPTLVHELVHVQQGNLCKEKRSEEIEGAAQIGSWEILAALANGGNKEASLSLVGELLGVSLGVAWAKAIEMDREEEFAFLRSKIRSDAISVARFERARRRWAEEKFTLVDILEKYEVKPLTQVFKAMATNADRIPLEEIALPLPSFRLGNWSWQYNSHPVFKVDDLHYFLAHLEEIVKEHIKKR